MSFKIEDGKGRGHIVGVNQRNHILTESTSRSESNFISKSNQNAFSLASSALGITSANTEQCILFIRNDDDDNDTIVTDVRVSCLGNTIWRIYRNPTSVANALTANAVNLNFNSGRTWAGHWSTGQDATTLTGGTPFSQLLLNGVSDIMTSDMWILGNGDTFAITANCLTATSIGTTVQLYNSNQNDSE